MSEKGQKFEAPAKHGRFLLSGRTFRTNVLIYFLSWTSLALILCAVIFQRETNSAMWWVVLVTFFNTLAVGLSHRELLRLTIQQEMEILANSKIRSQDGPGSEKLVPQNPDTLFVDLEPVIKQEDIVRHLRARGSVPLQITKRN